MRFSNSTRSISAAVAIDDRAAWDFTVVINSQSLSYRTAAVLLSGASLTVTLSGLYFVKTAVGIDLLDGPSVFHAIFF